MRLINIGMIRIIAAMTAILSDLDEPQREDKIPRLGLVITVTPVRIHRDAAECSHGDPRIALSLMSTHGTFTHVTLTPVYLVRDLPDVHHDKVTRPWGKDG